MSHSILTLMMWSLGLFLVGCAAPTDDTKALDEAAISKIQTAVAARMNELVAYAEAGDLESVISLYDQSGAGSYIDGAYRYASYQEVWDRYRANWNVASQDFGDPKTRVIVLSSDVALASAASDVSRVDTLGTAYQSRPWAVTIIWVRKDGQWQINSFHQHAEPSEPSPTE